jgi:hypothetical protein
MGSKQMKSSAAGAFAAGGVGVVVAGGQAALVQARAATHGQGVDLVLGARDPGQRQVGMPAV